MRPLSAPELLSVWERGLAESPLQRAQTVLAAAWPEASAREAAELSVGRRDARLLTLRTWSFGSRVTGLATCAGCGERLEATFDVADILAAPPAEPDLPLALQVDGYELSFRLPTVGDLAAIADAPDVEVARRRLLASCLLMARHDGVDLDADALPPGVVEALAARMAEADPQADVLLTLYCPACADPCRVTFDIADYFWSEIEAWAERILREVHALAAAYGWTEAEILSLSPQRRRAYLGLVQG